MTNFSKRPDILTGASKNPSGATHKDVDGDCWLITRANCFIWHSVRGVWVDYANYDEIDMSLLTPL